MIQTRTYDCSPTLNDTDVFNFCKTGYLMLESVVDDAINRRTTDYIDKNGHHSLLNEDWFIEAVFHNPQAAGAVRSLLGANFALPIKLPNHRVKCPMESQSWHRDGGSRYGPAVNHLQVFYYPQDTPPEMGPTEVLPGSHFFFSLQSWMGHYGTIRGAELTAAPAGSIFITAYSIWHRRSKSTSIGWRNMLKYIYWRRTPPQRDWISDPNFESGQPQNTKFQHPTHQQQHRNWFDAAEMYYWLCGSRSDFNRKVGHDHWPPGYPVPNWTPENYQNF